jgi:hypothetical protein
MYPKRTEIKGNINIDLKNMLLPFLFLKASSSLIWYSRFAGVIVNVQDNGETVNGGDSEGLCNLQLERNEKKPY